jgi:hypothetical protein
MSLDRLHRAVERLHLVYLGLLPALATFSVLVIYGHPAPSLLFIGGIVAVSVYLAVVISYTRPVRSLGLALLILLDGPLWAALSHASNRAPLSFAIDAFLVDGIAIWFAIVWLAVSTSRPTKEQRAATVGFALVALSTVLLTFWPYIREHVWGEGMRPFWLAAGIVEAVIVRHYLLEVDEVVRGEMTSAAYILVLLFVWIVAMSAGNIIHERRTGKVDIEQPHLAVQSSEPPSRGRLARRITAIAAWSCESRPRGRGL